MINKVALYKYKQFQSVHDLACLKDFLNQKIWMARVAGSNDPFEACFKLIPHKPETILNNDLLFKRYFNRVKSIYPYITESVFRNELSSGEAKASFKEFGNSFINTIFNDHGQLCLTNCPSNIPMWAYYGNNNVGYCLIFEMDFSLVFNKMELNANFYEEYKGNVLQGKEIIKFEFDDIHFIFGKISYSDTLPSIEQEKLDLIESDYEKAEYIFKNSIGVKSKQWEGENEYRLIANQNSNPDQNNKDGYMTYLVKYAPFLKVIGIIMGINTPSKDVFYDLCVKHKINLYQAERSETEYKINIKKVLNMNMDDLTSICDCRCDLSVLATETT